MFIRVFILSNLNNLEIPKFHALRFRLLNLLLRQIDAMRLNG